ncbi:MAG: ATP-dependent 6-phosphofructokinase [Acidobacteria bacterium]|nr:ATP-dependent 6-phosphofructokinase [Acidobacteriota bacterium]
MSLTRIGVLTGGGDAPGLNAVIRAVVKSACNHGVECLGIEDSFDGLAYPDRTRVLAPRDVTGILRRGGTILGTTNRGNPFERGDQGQEYAAACLDRFQDLGLGGLVAIGGDGTLAIAHEFAKRGMPLVCVPKTIDNDLPGTNSTFGFDTAVSFATHAIDRLHSTAEAHRRVMVVEVMGRTAGWIALYAGVAGGGDVILIPEIPYDLARVAERIAERERLGARSSIVVVAEGAVPKDGTASVVTPAHDGRLARLGGLGAQVAAHLEDLTGKEARSVRLGHLQRGGEPTSFDRVLATRFGGKAVDLMLNGQFGRMVANRPPDIVSVPLEAVVGQTKPVPADLDLIRTARALGISFGEPRDRADGPPTC